MRRILTTATTLLLALLGLPLATASAQESSAFFQVRPLQGIEGFAWSAGEYVQIAWDTPASTPVDVNVDGEGHWFWQPEDWSTFPTAGSHVVVTEGATTRELTVSSLWVTRADPTSDVVAGIADPGDTVWVSPFGPYPWWPVVTDASGHWSLDLSTTEPPVDLTAWQTGGAAEVRTPDYGNATSFNWATPTPFIRAMVFGWGAVWGHGWLPGSSVDVTVDKPGTANDMAKTLTADTGGMIAWDFEEGQSLDPGDVVTAVSADDPLVTRTVIVTDFDIDTVSLPSTVIGHAPAGESVQVYVGYGDGVSVTANTENVWTVDSGLDLLSPENSGINASMSDEDGDWIETSFYVRDHLELGMVGPSNGQTYGRVGESVTYWTDLWVAYHADPSTYTVTWNWGDGTTSAGTLAFDQGDPNIASMYGSHAYRRVGLYEISVTVSQVGIDPATSVPNDGSFVTIYDLKRPATVSGTATVHADAGSGGYYDVAFSGGNVNLTMSNVARATKTGALTGSVTVTVPDMNNGDGMTFTGSTFEYLYSNSANRLGNEVMLWVHGTVTHPSIPDTAAGALIHVIDRAKGPDLVRVFIQDEGGAGYPILDTAATAAPGQEPPWNTSLLWQLSTTDDQTTASTLRIK